MQREEDRSEKETEPARCGPEHPSIRTSVEEEEEEKGEKVEKKLLEGKRNSKKEESRRPAEEGGLQLFRLQPVKYARTAERERSRARMIVVGHVTVLRKI